MIHPATDMDVVRQLFREYEAAIEVDLCFQGFEEELAELPGRYTPPHGALLLAVEGNEIAGCVALRPQQAGVCEMKRLYVRPPFRGKGLGRDLAQAIIAEARPRGYRAMRLDTLPANMPAAVGLYRALGFVPIAAYNDNPLEGVLHMELRLSAELPIEIRDYDPAWPEP